MATFVEWTKRHGLDSARRQFSLTDHLIFVVRPGHSVTARCGRHIGSEPLGMGQSVDEAKEKLRASILHSHDTEQTITED